MGAGEVNGWLVIAEKLGPFGPIAVVVAFLIYSTSQRSKTPSENVPPVSRAEFDKLESRLHDIEASLNQIKGALGVK